MILVFLLISHAIHLQFGRQKFENWVFSCAVDFPNFVPLLWWFEAQFFSPLSLPGPNVPNKEITLFPYKKTGESSSSNILFSFSHSGHSNFLPEKKWTKVFFPVLVGTGVPNLDHIGERTNFCLSLRSVPSSNGRQFWIISNPGARTWCWSVRNEFISASPSAFEPVCQLIQSRGASPSHN